MFESPGSITGNQPPSERYYNSPAYNEAVNAARFVKGFGITALVYSILTLLGIGFLNGGVGVGVGLFVLRYDSGRFYRILGIAMIVLAFVGIILPVSQVVLAGAVLGKGIQALGVFAKEGNTDDEWAPSRQRALIGTIAAGLALVIAALILLLTAIGLTYLLLKGEMPQ